MSFPACTRLVLTYIHPTPAPCAYTCAGVALLHAGTVSMLMVAADKSQKKLRDRCDRAQRDYVVKLRNTKPMHTLPCDSLFARGCAFIQPELADKKVS